MWDDAELDAVMEIAVDAGKEILEVYHDSEQPQVDHKADNSPLTDADRRAHRLINDRLGALEGDTPVLSEESDPIEPQDRLAWQRYWLVDPLDGTKEFVNRNGEFTVNIALIDKGEPVLGVVHVPVSGETYLGRQGAGAWHCDGEGHCAAIRCSTLADRDRLRVVASRSHRGPFLDGLLVKLEQQFGGLEVMSMGSSLKICLLAAGRADFYPRLAPTCEWDTAAAHAVLAAAGGDIIDTDMQPLRYNQKADLLNPHFLAIADGDYGWGPLLRGMLA